MNNNNGSDVRKNARKGKRYGTQPEPLSGSKKVKNQNHSRNNKNPGHGM